MDACQGCGAGHRVTGIDFIALGEEVLAACPDVEPAGGLESGAEVPEHEVLRGFRAPSVGGDGGVEATDVLDARGDGPAVAGIERAGVEFVLGGGDDGRFHVEEAVVGIDGPGLGNAPGGLELNPGVGEGAGVHVEGRGSLAGDGDDEVLGVDVEEVDAVGEPSVKEPLGEGDFVVPHGLGLQVRVLRGEHVHLADGGVSEAFGGGGFEFYGTGEVEGEPCLGYPFGAHVGMVVGADACVDGEEGADVLAEVDVSGYFMVVPLEVVVMLAGTLALDVVVPFLSPETIPVDACGEAVAPEETGALVGGDAEHVVVGDEAVEAGVAVVIGVGGVAVVNPVVTPVVEEADGS